MSVKSTLRKWLSEGELERLIDTLQAIAERHGDKYFQSDVSFQAGRYNGLVKDRNMGVIDDQFYNIQLNNIRMAVSSLINKVPESATLPGSAPEPPPTDTSSQPMGEGQEASPDPQANNDSAQPSPGTVTPPATSTDIPWIIGFLLLIGSVVAVGMIPCPTAAQQAIFRLMMALGAGGIAVVLPGLFEVNTMGVKAGSSIGVFALVYLVNPAGAITNDQGCDNDGSFDFTIRLVKQGRMNPQYPKLQGEVLKLWEESKWEDAILSADDIADFKALPGSMKNHGVPVMLLSPYWKLAEDSIYITGRSGQLNVYPDSTLKAVRGQVRQLLDGSALEGVIITIAGQRDTTAANGLFEVAILPGFRQKEYTIEAYKQGFESIRDKFPYTGLPIDLRMKAAEQGR